MSEEPIPAESSPESPEKSPIMVKIAGPDEVRVGGIGLLIALIVLVLTIAALAIGLALARRKATQEKNKVRRLQEMIDQAEDDKKLAENEGQREQITDRITDIQTKIDQHKENLAKLDAAHKDYVETMDRVKTWDDLLEDA